jgi:hypothetical protein
MLSVDQIKELCKDDLEVKSMTDQEIETLEAACYRIAHALLKSEKENINVNNA